MTFRLILIAGLTVLAGCAHREPRLATCDGSDRRPANPYGSVLAPLATTDARVSDISRTEGDGGCA